MLSFKDIKQLEKSKKARDSQGLFITEGKKLFEEAPRERIVQVLVSKSFEAAHRDLLDRIPAGCDVQAGIDDSRFASLSDTKSPQGILTVVRQMELDASARRRLFEKKNPFFVILENLQDPGNAGTVMRTGEAAGVDAVILTEGSVDIYGPKTIRSTMGSIYRVPHFYTADILELIDQLDAHTIETYAAHLKGKKSYSEPDYRAGTAFIIGNEGNGIKDETASHTGTLIRIPMSGKVESLNAAMAAGILMYEARRQRQQ